MNPDWLNILSVLTIFTLAIISSGPNFVMVVHTSLSDLRRAGTALGVAVGSGLFALAGLLGLILLVSSLPNFAVLIRLAGGAYLAWLGAGMIRKALRRPRGDAVVPGMIRRQSSPARAFRTGLFTNLTNPKAWAFYFSLFTLVAASSTSLWAKIFLNLAMFLISFSWYAGVALLLSDRRTQPHFLRLQPLIQGGARAAAARARRKASAVRQDVEGYLRGSLKNVFAGGRSFCEQDSLRLQNSFMA